MTTDKPETSSKEVEKFECGTSLAEQEHRSYDSGGVSESRDHLSALRTASLSSGSKIDSVSALRDALASSVVRASSSPYEMFASPFEVPGGKTAQTHPTTHTDGGSKFLRVPLVYCDQTASNRPVQSIENYIRTACLPLYGNTHTNTSITGSQSTAFVAEARQIVAEACNAKITGKASLDTVLFAGQGTTSAVELLVDCLGLQNYSPTSDRSSRPVVFVGPYEHHSNLIPWRESGCEIVMIPESSAGQVDLEALEQALKHPSYANRLVKMGTFTAASNVTGKVSDVDAIAATLHRHGALAFFDYATGAPYLDMNMNPTTAGAFKSFAPSTTTPSLIAKDAIFFSPHKLLGGAAGTPGVLVVKKHLVGQTNAPSRSGGGTVFYVTHTHHRFLSNRMERYEGGTPHVVGILRCGLTFLLKRQVEQAYAKVMESSSESSHQSLVQAEYDTHRYVVKHLQKRVPNLVLLGSSQNDQQDHLPIFSFLIRCGKRFLHYNYVCALLNDVFGIQSRGGCQCSGPYSQRLLGLTDRRRVAVGNSEHDSNTMPCLDVPNEGNQQIEHALVHFKERAELLRPGYTRLSLPFKGLRSVEVEYVVSALEWIGKHGWKLLCYYRCNHRTGEWRHASRQGKPLGRTERKWLSHFDVFGVGNQRPATTATATTGSEHETMDSILKQTLQVADQLIEEAKTDQQSLQKALRMVLVGQDGEMDDDAVLEELRWFVYPREVAPFLSQGLDVVPDTDSSDTLGVIRPLTTNSMTATVPDAAPVVEPMDCSPLKDAPTVREIKPKVLSTEPHKTAAATTRKRKTTETDGMLNFRDGDHTGFAPLDEIVAGMEDGELSQNCQVFDVKSDSWMKVDAYTSSSQKSKTTDVVVDATPKQSDNETVVKPPPKRFGNAKDDKNQKKKPARTSEAWGKSSSVVVPSVAADRATTREEEEEKKSDNASIRPEQTPTGKKKKKRGKGIQPPAKLMRLCNQAVMQWDMIQDGDRLLLGLSGGKDSLSLLHVLLEFQRKLKAKFELEVCTVDPLTPSFDPSPLIPYVESLGLKYHYLRDDIVDRANKSGRDGSQVSSLCAFCARMKRGLLYTCARKNNCNKLVLAQHLDDCAESFFMSVMHNGFLRTMKANYQVNAGDISVIRPMVYCRESLMTDFAKSAGLPVINENCPACFEEPKERARIKKLLTREESLYPDFYDNIKRSILPLMHEDSTPILRSYVEEAVARTRKVPYKNKKGQTKQQKLENKEGRAQPEAQEEHATKRLRTTLSDSSEDDLLREIAKRRAEKFQLSGAMGRLTTDEGPPDPTGQVCSLNGGDGTIPCRELME